MTIRLITLLLLLGFATCVFAQDLYTGRVAVQDQGDAERRAALPEALRNVLQKISGLRELPAGPALDSALGTAGRMMVAFSYQQSSVQPGPEVQAQPVLVVSFLPAAVDQVVRDLQLPRWRPERQTVLTWAMLDDGGGVVLMPLEYQYAWDYFAQALQNRGLPMTWAEPGDELLQALDIQAVWAGDSDEELLQAGGDQALGILRARRVLSEWDVQFQYLQPGQHGEAETAKTGQERAGLVFTDQLQEAGAPQGRRPGMLWQSRSVDLLQALGEVANQAVDQVATLNTLGAAGQGQWQSELLVGLLDGADAYARLLGYLDGLSLVDRYALLGVGPQGVRLQLTLNTDPQFLQSALRSDGVLTRDDQEGVYRMTELQSP